MSIETSENTHLQYHSLCTTTTTTSAASNTEIKVDGLDLKPHF